MDSKARHFPPEAVSEIAIEVLTLAEKTNDEERIKKLKQILEDRK